MFGTLTGYTALDWLPSVALACLVIAAAHLAILMVRYAAPEAAPAGHSPRDQADPVVGPTTTVANQAIEPQATLDSATSLERRSLLSSPPSTNSPKDLDIPASVKRASSSALSGIPILAPRAASAPDGNLASPTADDIRTEIDVAGPSSKRVAAGLGQHQQHPGDQQLSAAQKGVSAGNGGLYRPGSEPARLPPLSPGTASQNAYLVSISDDYVAPLSALRDHPTAADSDHDRAAAGGASRQRKLQPLPPVSSASDEGSVISRSSSGTSAHGRQDVVSAPAVLGSTAAAGASGALEDSSAAAASSSQPKARLDLAVVRQQLQQQQGRDDDGRCACVQHHPVPDGDAAVWKLQVPAAVPAATSQASVAAVPVSAPAVPAHILHAPSAVRPPRPSALYTSPMQHITVSVKVPNPYVPVTAHSLQNIVAQHVISAAAAQQPPQHTIMHMVSVPGCIQLLMSVVNWQMEQQPPDPEAAPSVTAEAAEPAAVTPAGPGLRDSVQSLTVDLATGANYISSSIVAAPADAVASGPAPSWMVQAVCSAVQEFMRTHAAELTAAQDASTAISVFGEAAGAADNSSVSFRPCTPGALPEQADNDREQQQQQQPGHALTTPVLIDINGQKFSMTPGSEGPAGPWQLYELDPAHEASSCFGTADWSASAAAGGALPTAHVTAPSPAAAPAPAAGDEDPGATAAADDRWPLPDAVWAWPLCLPTIRDSDGDGSGGSTSSNNSAWQPIAQPSPASAAGPVIAVHGLTADCVRLVVTDPAAAVVADCTCQLSNGVARLSPAASTSISRYTMYCVSQPCTPATAMTASGLQSAAVRFALPVLYLPDAVVVELHEAARKIMLEQSRGRWLQMHQDPNAVTDAADYYYYYLSELNRHGDGDNNEAAANSQRDAGAADEPSAVFAVSGSSDDSGGVGSRHVGSFTTQRSQNRGPAAGRESLFEDLAGDFPQQSPRRRQRHHHRTARPQQQGSNGASGNGNGTDSGSSRMTFEEEDAENHVSLRGRLFDGADVHQLLQQQFLAVMSDIGLLLDLAAAAVQGRSADAAAAGVNVNRTKIAVTIDVDDGSSRGAAVPPSAAAAEPVEVTRIMASAVGQQLLTWAGGLNCWACCQLVLSLLLDFGVELAMQDTVVGREHLATAANVQALLLGTVVPEAAAALADEPPLAAEPAASASSPLPAVPAAAVQLLPQSESLSEVSAVTVTAKEVMASPFQPTDSACAAAAVAEQQRLHTLLEGRLSGAGSSESPMQWWGNNAQALSRGKSTADSIRARDQARAAAAAAIAGNMPGSAALGRKRSSFRASTEAGSSAAAAVATTPALSGAASGPTGSGALTAGAAEGTASKYGSSSSVPVPTYPSIGPASTEAAAASAVTSRTATAAAAAAIQSAAVYADVEAQRQAKARKHQRMSIKDSASEVISRLMRRKSSSAGQRGSRSGSGSSLGRPAAIEQ